jgi:hypothetical protein
MLLGNLGIVAHDQADLATARTLYEESLALLRRLGYTRFVANTLDDLANLACEQGDAEAAMALATEGLLLYRELGDKHGASRALNSQGDAACARSDFGAAAALYEESLALRKRLDDRPGIAESLEGLARVAGAQGQERRAVHLLAAADTLRAAGGAPLARRMRPAEEQAVLALHLALGEAAFAAAWATGQAMTLEDAVTLALEAGTAR